MAAFTRSLGPGDALVGLGSSLSPASHAQVALCRINLLDGSATANFVADFRPTHILHLAALSSVQQSIGSAAQTWRSNVLGLLNLAEAVTTHAKDATFLFVSSGEVYGRAFLCGVPVDESTRPWPTNTYSRTKLVGEDLLLDTLAATDVKLVTLRPFNHIGPGQDERFVVPSFAGQVARIEAGLGSPVVDVGDLSAKRDFLDVSDVVAAYVTLVEDSDGLPDRSTFNIASGLARPISDILDHLTSKARVPFQVRIAEDRLRPSEIPTASGDASALTAAIGWRPKVSWDESITSVLDDARSRILAMKEQN
jgi:GDP-4-dehydro-6-deoxy-D-mannose reductase